MAKYLSQFPAIFPKCWGKKAKATTKVTITSAHLWSEKSTKQYYCHIWNIYQKGKKMTFHIIQFCQIKKKITFDIFGFCDILIWKIIKEIFA